MATDVRRPAPPRAQRPGRARLIRRARERARAIPRALILILLVGAVQALAWNVALPAFQGPDEDAHFAYVQYLAETGKLPSASVGQSPVSTEEHDALSYLNLFPLRGVLGARPAWSAADLRYWQQIQKSMPPGAAANGAGANPIAKDPPLYYALMSVPYNIFAWLPLLQRIFVLRLFNALCFLATIALVWSIAGDLFGGTRWKQVLAAGAVALEPQLAFMSAVINADNLLIALTTATLLASLRVAMRGPSMRRVLIMSLLAAAAALTHGRGLVNVPVIATALVVGWIRFRPGVRQIARQLAGAVGTLGGAAALYLLFGTPAGGGAAYGGQVGALNSGGYFNIRQFLSSIYQFYFPRLPGMRPRLGPAYGYRQVFIETFYGAFGWLEVTFKPRVYALLEVASAVGIIGLYTALIARWRRIRASWPAVIVLLSLLVTNLVFLHYVSYRALLGNGATNPLIVGRYLLPMIALFGLAIAFTIGSLPRRLGPPVAAFVLSAGVLLSLTGIGITAVRFYA